MKQGIHPEYKPLTITCACGEVIHTRSTRGGTLKIEICSKCHPFFTGRQKFVDTAGRVERFQRKYARLPRKAQAAPRPSEAPSARPSSEAQAAGQPDEAQGDRRSGGTQEAPRHEETQGAGKSSETQAAPRPSEAPSARPSSEAQGPEGLSP